MASLPIGDMVLKETIDSLKELVLFVDRRTMRILEVNKSGSELLGWSREQILDRSLIDLSASDGLAHFSRINRLNPLGAGVAFEERLVTSSDAIHTFSFVGKAIGPDPWLVLLTGHRLQYLDDAEAVLGNLSILADLTDDLFVVCDRSGAVEYINDAVGRVFGDQQVIGRVITEFIHPDDTGLELMLASRTDLRIEGPVLVTDGQGEPLTLYVRGSFDRASQRWFTVHRDISQLVRQERRMEQLHTELRRQATTDPVTGLANRFALDQRLAMTVESDERCAVLFIDMDDFKSVNDTMGHGAGDKFLRCVSQRIQRAVKLVDFVARLGGDEFVVLLPSIDEQEAITVGERLLDAVRQHYSFDGETLSRSCSIGVALREAGESADSILGRADRAAYEAKDEGRNCVVVA